MDDPNVKKWYASKTVWVNFLALIATFIQGYYKDCVISPEYQGFALTIINIILRYTTKEEIVW